MPVASCEHGTCTLCMQTSPCLRSMSWWWTPCLPLMDVVSQGLARDQNILILINTLLSDFEKPQKQCRGP